MNSYAFTQQHDLKISADYYRDVVLEKKQFEVRKNDRDFQVGDVLALHEYSCRFETYSGNVVFCRVVYLLAGSEFPALDSDYCVMGIKAIHEHRGEVSA